MTDQKKSDQTTSSEKPWGGRFSEPTDAFVEKFTASVGFDQRLYHHDITGSIAHATMLAEVGVLTTDERDQIIEGLKGVKADIEAGNFQWSVSLEDVHMNIEARLTDRIGITGKKLHTGRSRNDQVATDIRLYLRDEIDVIAEELKRLQAGLLTWPSARRRPSCPASPICKPPSRSPSGTTCWPGTKCWYGMPNACRIAASGST